MEKKEKKETASVVSRFHDHGGDVGAVAGEIAGAVVGSIAGPVGVVGGMVVGAVIGAVTGKVIEEQAHRADAHDAELDDEIGVTKGDLGAKGSALKGSEATASAADTAAPPEDDGA